MCFGKFEHKNKEVVLPDYPLKILNVRVNGVKIRPDVISNIQDIREKGFPNRFVVKTTRGKMSVLFFPRPTQKADYLIEYVPSVEELDLESYVDAPGEYINCLIDYVASRVSKSETAYEDIYRKIETLTQEVVPIANFVDPYY